MARFRSFAQYLDDDGKPLINGLLDFFSSGSSDEVDRLDLFSDVAQKIPLDNPVVLSAAGRQPNVFFDGQARVVSRTSAGVQIEVRDPVPSLAATGTAFTDYNALVTYDSDQLVVGSDGNYYLSIAGGNLNNDPTSTSGFWQEFRFNNVYDAAQTYSVGDIALATDDNLYISRVNANLNNEPSASPTEWKIMTAVSAVSGPGSSTDNAIARFNGTSGQTIQNSGVLIDDTDNITGLVNLTSTGLFKFATGLVGGSLPASPDGTFHVHTASAGAVTANTSADELVLENSGSGGMTILVPDASAGNIIFGSPSDSVGATIDWGFDAGTFNIGPSKVGAVMNLRGDNGITNLTLSGTAGSELATFVKNVTTTGNITCNTSISGVVATSVLAVTLVDNLATAAEMKQGTDNYFLIDTTNAAEAMTFGNAVTNPTFNFLGSGITAFAGVVSNASQVQWSKGADVASATALPVLTDGNYFDVTGTTTITSINTTAIGTVIKLHFDGILILTHDATDLILPTGANITTQVGDEAEFVEYATGDYRCTSYTRADGTALSGGSDVGSLIFISTVTASGDATIDITGIDSTFDEYQLHLLNVVPTSDASDMFLRTSTDGGSSFDAGASDYDYSLLRTTGSSSTVDDSAAANHIRLATTIGSFTTENGVSAVVHLIRPAETDFTSVWSVGMSADNLARMSTHISGGQRASAADVDAIQILFSAGLVESGELKLYGVKKA